MSETPSSDQHERPNWFIALAVALVFALGNVGLSRTSAGRWLEFKAYDLLHSALTDLDRDFPIVRVDIGDIPSDPANPTSRPTLEGVLSQIFERNDDQQPAVIGIDIDFSPVHPYQHPSQAEQHFFDFCNDIRQGLHSNGTRRRGIPIYLGVGRTAYGNPDEWFDYHEYIPMAADIMVNADDTHQATRWTFDAKGDVYGETRRLPSMGQALAQAYAQYHRNSLPAPSGFLVDTIPVDPVADRPRVGGEYDEDFKKRYGLESGVSLVNYSKLDQMREQRLKVEMRDGKPVVTGDFAGKIVLLGDTEAVDVFTVPGPIKPLKGVYLHACAAYTFVREPLYNMTHLWRFVLDVLLSIVVVILLAIVDYVAHDHPRRKLFGRAVHYSVLGLVLIVGLVLVRLTGIMWFDFIAIVVALWIHPPIEHHVEHHWKQLTARWAKRAAAGGQTSAPAAKGDQT